MFQFMRKLWGENKGATIIEFAFVFPILIIMTFPLIDYARYILLQQKVIKTAFVLGDSVSMSRPVDGSTTAADISQFGDYLTTELFDSTNGGVDLIDSIPDLMIPFQERNGENLWQVVISFVYRPDAGSPPLLYWQYDEDSRSFNGNRPSQIGQVTGFPLAGSPAVLPPTLTASLQPNEGVVVVEVTATHVPIVPDLSGLGVPFITRTDLTHTSYMRARYGDLRYIWTINCPPTSTTCP
jgi:hypothetical protein